MDEALRRCRPLLGTFVEVAATGVDLSAIDAAFAAVARVHAAMSFHDEASDLALIRNAPVGTMVTVATDTITVLRLAINLHHRSQGLFEVAIGSQLVADGLLPPPAGYAAAILTGTSADIEIIDDQRLICHRPLLIDLGGIAKGHAVDCAVQVLTAAGAEQAIVNAGGDLYVIGATPQRIYLRGTNGQADAAIDIADAALASSGPLAVAAPGAGPPHYGRNRLRLAAGNPVTVIAETCIIADAMTKIALAEPELAAAMLAELGGAIIARPDASLAA